MANAVRRHAILLDGGFVIKKIQAQTRAFPSADVVEQLALRVCSDAASADSSLLRAYFYHARPATGEITNPLNAETLRLSGSIAARNHESLIDTLELKPDFAVRLGETTVNDWRIGHSAMKALMNRPRPIEARDLVPNISQKGVDLRIGLDLARLALREMVDTVIVVTGDSDLIPAFKFVRREGLRLVLATLGHGVRRDLRAHADVVLDASLDTLDVPLQPTPK